MCSLVLKSDYYIVFMNPRIHKKDWNALRLIMKVTEINYCVFIDNEIEYMEIHGITKEEFNTYNYNPN
jgi:hypothetical protein